MTRETFRTAFLAVLGGEAVLLLIAAALAAVSVYEWCKNRGSHGE